jgi:SAM-dependent methyltransferase
MTLVSNGPDPQRIRSMFASIANRYDRANTILSAGVHHRWRRAAVRMANVKPGDRILDSATGTGDLAIEFQKAVGQRGVVVGTDFTPEMIELARAKSPSIRFEVADVTQLPYDAGSFDVAAIAFGIRNVGDPRRGIAELARVVRSGGRVIVLVPYALQLLLRTYAPDPRRSHHRKAGGLRVPQLLRRAVSVRRRVRGDDARVSGLRDDRRSPADSRDRVRLSRRRQMMRVPRS